MKMKKQKVTLTSLKREIKKLKETIAVYERAQNYQSFGHLDVTEAVRFILASSKPGPWGGPHRWSRQFLRSIGRLCSAYAKYYFDKNYGL